MDNNSTNPKATMLSLKVVLEVARIIFHYVFLSMSINELMSSTTITSFSVSIATHGVYNLAVRLKKDNSG